MPPRNRKLTRTDEHLDEVLKFHLRRNHDNKRVANSFHKDFESFRSNLESLYLHHSEYNEDGRIAEDDEKLNFPGRLEETKAEVFPKLMAESFQILFFFRVKRTGKIGLRRLPNAVERNSLIPSSHASLELVTSESSLP